jgi:hypothetical protein
MAVPDLEAAVGHADIVSCATLAMTPLIHGRRLRSGSHLDLIGSFTPSMREAADDCFVDAALYVDTEEALRKSGDLLEPIKRGVLDPADVRCTLTTLARGEASGRRAADERTIFKSVRNGARGSCRGHRGLRTPARRGLAHRHQARVSAGRRGVDAQRALEHQALQRDVDIAGPKTGDADDGPGSPGDSAADGKQFGRLAVMKDGIEADHLASPVLYERDAISCLAGKTCPHRLRADGPQGPAAHGEHGRQLQQSICLVASQA